MAAMRVLYNARIRSLDPERPQATALAIDDRAPKAGRILALGDDDTIRAGAEKGAQYEDMAGRVILPGLTDAHIHLRYYALGLQKLDCATATKEECLVRVAERAQATPPGEWIQGHGWNQNEWPGGFGTAAELDRAAPQHPVYLTAISLHAAWTNSSALRIAGIDASTPDPPGGKIQRSADGQPTGILFEQAAMELVSDIIPQPTQEETISALKAAQADLWAMGLTGAHDFSRHGLQELRILKERQELGLRVLKQIVIDNFEGALEAGLRTGDGDDTLRIGALKVFADGALGPHTAAMFEPYEDDPDNRGILIVDREALFEYASRAARGGLSMSVHAIGDRANHEVLDAFAELRRYEREQGLPHLRHRIEHVQLLHPDDLGRLAQLDVTASMQPIHATADMQAADAYWGQRARYAYAWRSLLERGTRLVFGSDAPVDSPNPFWGLHAALTRRRADGSPASEGWYPEQRLDLTQALMAYTSGPAYAAGMEDRLGRLTPGYLADLIVLDLDPFTCVPEELRRLQPTATMVGGDWVWRK